MILFSIELVVVVERYNKTVNGTQVQLNQQLDYSLPKVT
jgi:hypothetical protein